MTAEEKLFRLKEMLKQSAERDCAKGVGIFGARRPCPLLRASCCLAELLSLRVGSHPSGDRTRERQSERSQFVRPGLSVGACVLILSPVSKSTKIGLGRDARGELIVYVTYRLRRPRQLASRSLVLSSLCAHR